MQACMSVFFQARFGQATQAPGASASEFRQVSVTCARVVRRGGAFGATLYHTCLRMLADMVHMEHVHLDAVFDGGLPDAYVRSLASGARPRWRAPAGCHSDRGLLPQSWPRCRLPTQLCPQRRAA